MRPSPIAILALTFLMTGVACPKETPAEEPASKDPAVAPADEPPVETPPVEAPPVVVPTGTDEEKNTNAKADFGLIVAAIDLFYSTNKDYPPVFGELLHEELRDQTFTNAFSGDPLVATDPATGQTTIGIDHSFYGKTPGTFSYAPIVMPDGTHGGYVFLGYGVNPEAGAAEAEVATFKTARNWIEFNKAATNPRLPNTCPVSVITAAFFSTPGVGKTPPADYEAPPEKPVNPDNTDFH